MSSQNVPGNKISAISIHEQQRYRVSHLTFRDPLDVPLTVHDLLWVAFAAFDAMKTLQMENMDATKMHMLHLMLWC